MAFLTDENAHFNGSLYQCLKVKTVGNVKHLILWNTISDLDRERLTTLINNYGGNVPLAGPIAGRHIVDMGGSVIGGNPTGLANDATEYTATITIDGTNVMPITIVGSAAQTFTTLIGQITADLAAGTVGTASINGDGNIQVDSATTGLGSTVWIEDGDLFRSLTGFVEVSPADLPGADTFEEVLQLNRIPEHGKTFYDTYYYLIRKIGLKPNYTTYDSTLTYWDGTNWLRMIDDAVVV